MKILYVTTISNTVNAFLIPHIKYLIDKGNDVGVAFKTVQEASPELNELGCKIHEVEFQRSPINKENLNAYKKIKKIIIDEEYDLVHVHTPVASFLTRFACRKKKNIKVLYTAHGFHFFKGAPKKNWLIYYTLEKIAARWTDVIITMNDEDFHFARKLKLRNKGFIYKTHGVGIDLNKFVPQTPEKKASLRHEYKYNEEDFILIYVGELCYRKHQDLLIEAVNMLKGELSNLKLLLVGGGGRANEYKNTVSKLGLEKHVFFLGHRTDVNNLMAISDIAISTSRQEGLPVNVMEAMATGLPLIVTDCRGNRDLVVRGENGIMVGIEDASACADAVRELYYSNELREEFGNKSKELINKYSIENVILEMRNIYT